jgi:hypothetical protein
MRPSKIEKLNLQTQFLPIYHKTGGNELQTAKLLSQLAGEKISHMAVRRYLKSLDVIDEVKDVATAKHESVKRQWLEEKDNIITAYQAIIQKALIPLKNAKTDKQIKEAVPVALSALQRAMNMHNIGNTNSQVQINQQFNFDNAKKEIAQIIVEETDNNGGRKYRDAIIDRIGRLGGTV